MLYNNIIVVYATCDRRFNQKNAEFDSSRELALAATKQGLNLADLAAHSRLYNLFRNSGAAFVFLLANAYDAKQQQIDKYKLLQYDLASAY